MKGEGLFAGLTAAVVGTVLVHAGLGLGLTALDTTMRPVAMPEGLRYQKAAKLAYRGRHPEIGIERRRIETQCTSIPECNAYLDAEIIEVKIAKLGSIEQDPKKLPEIQQYEEPEKIEEAVNVEQEVVEVKPLPLQDFMRKKAELDKKWKKRRQKVDNLFNVDDDPRAKPTAFENIVGRNDGDVYGKGVDANKLDTYFGRASLEIHKVFHVPSSIGREDLKKQSTMVVITKMSADGEILAYRVRQSATNKTYNLAAEATLKQFMPGEGGRLRLPPPDQEVLDFVNTKGVIIDLNGRLFQ